jgi:ABC-type uncharacterized transport system auxiliary subunit
MMKKIIILAAAIAVLAACSANDDEKAEKLMQQIEQLYEQKQYSATLDSIEALRNQFPKAVESRKRALVIWNDASLQMARADIAKTDSALLATEELMKNETDIYKHNILGLQRDSLKARYEALCGVVKMILHRKK